MNKLSVGLLSCSLAFGGYAWGQNPANDSRRMPTIEDRLTQLEQVQGDLTSQIEALNQKVTNLQQEILGQNPKESTTNTSQAPARPSSDSVDSSADETRAPQEASYDVFYDRLQSDGQWFNDESYGYVWQPNTASSDQTWRPYTEGRWVYTDRGWTWVSNEKFGWATYHYGRWAKLNDRGWVWIPGDQWAPAWVSWRESDDYIGWAPLPPEAQSDQDVKIEGWADNYYNIGPSAYVFLRTTDLGNDNYRDFMASPRDSIDFISRTKNVTNIYTGRDGVIDGGPNYDQLIERSKVRIDKFRLDYVQQNSPQTQFGATARGDQLQVLAPSPRLQRVATVEPKIAGNITNAEVDRGWQNVDATSAKQLKQTWEKQAPVPTTLPQKPQSPKPVVASAKGREGKQSDVGNNAQNKPSTITQQPPRTQNREATVPVPSPTPQSKNAVQSGQQPPATGEQRGQEPNQGQRAETTPPAAKQNEKVLQPGQQPPATGEQRSERPETTPPAPASSSERNRTVQQPDRESTSADQNQHQESRDLEKTQATPKRSESTAPKVGRPAQSEDKPTRSGSSEGQAPAAANGANEKRLNKPSPKEEIPNRQQGPNEELSSRGDREDEQSPRKPNSNEAAQGSNDEKKGQGRDQSGDSSSNRKKLPKESEKKKVEPSVPQ
jgi:hypothetical protein